MDYDINRTMIKDLLKAEFFVNALGIETRCGEGQDEFLPIDNIIKSVVEVCTNNPTIIDDCVEFLKTKPATSDEMKDFLHNYKFGSK